MEYREIAAPPALRHILDCIWTMEGQARELESAMQSVLPDGRPELVVHLGDPFERIDADGTAQRQAAILFAGQLTRQLLLRPSGRIAVAALRFRPDGAAALLDVPQAELTGLTASLEELSPSLFRAVAEISSDTDSPSGAAARLVQRLAPRLTRATPDVRVRFVVEAIQKSAGRVSVDRVAREAGLTRRHLERRFRHLVGVSPKRLARIARFQHALALLERPGISQRGTRTAVDCGYADQAHFIKDFKALAGCPPGTHLLQRGELTGFFTAACVERAR